jgi:hypothetical protein
MTTPSLSDDPLAQPHDQAQIMIDHEDAEAASVAQR